MARQPQVSPPTVPGVQWDRTGIFWFKTLRRFSAACLRPDDSRDVAGVLGSDLAEAAALGPCVLCELPSPAASWCFV